MPMNEYHACRMREPGDFEDGSLRTVSQGKVQIVIGKPKGKDTTTAQSVRYPTSEWSESAARQACKKRGGILFEPAKAEEETAAIPEVTVTKEDFMTLISGGELVDLEAASTDGKDTPILTFELETRELKNVPIFAAGTWTNSAGAKRTWTESDLDEIAENAKTLNGKVIPFLRVDHTDEKTHKRITGRFKIGDLTNVRRVGKELFADIVKIPRRAWELMKAGVFGRPSAEIFPTFKDEAGGTVYKNVLSGAAILSGKHPAVTTLDDIYDLFGMSDIKTLFRFEAASNAELFEWGSAEHDVEPENEPESPEGGDDMTEEQVKKLIDEAVAKAKDESAKKVAELEAKVTAEAARADAAQLENEKHDAAEFERSYSALVDKAKAEGRLIPAQEAAIRTMVDGWKLQAKDGTIEFQSGTEKKTGSIIEAFGAYLDGLPVVVKFGESGRVSDPAKTSKGGEPQVSIQSDVKRYAEKYGYEIDAESAEKDAKVREVMRAKKLNYMQALNEVEQVDVTIDEQKIDSEKVTK